ncbi:MAG: sigma 54-interacting transcriptional regulator [Candidatus Wallbacteria bacterium]|nr:sigma 54-interacting transcriptional regulator [Candidatus Wallbacteria bacterium]
MTAGFDPDDPNRPTEGIDLGRSGITVITLKKVRVWVAEGPDTGRDLLVDTPKIRIGKGPDNDLPLTDAAVSRHHAVLERRREGWMLRDTGSKNGTFLNDIRVNDAFLPAGARIRLGRTVLKFQTSDEDLVVTPSRTGDFHGVLATSSRMREIIGILERVAPSDVSVVLHGETGTGKEVVARALHRASPRANAPFVVIDCGNLNKDLVGSELFGHEVGAFTGAAQRRIGAFEAADGGTLFLDELGELPLELQPRLLRVLEQREITRLGSSAAKKVNVRVVSATHRDLEQRVSEGTFREDLFYRLSQVEVRLPPLRDRPEDIELLSGHFLDAALARATGRARVTISAEALAILKRGSWRGNVRELRNVIERALALCTGTSIGPGDLLLRDRAPDGRPAPAAAGTRQTLANRSLEDIEKEAILQTLRAHGGNKTRAAAVLGIATITLRDKMKRYGLSDDDVK